jgi:hypothetical protein
MPCIGLIYWIIIRFDVGKKYCKQYIAYLSTREAAIVTNWGLQNNICGKQGGIGMA